jgi:hypothetical protein
MLAKETGWSEQFLMWELPLHRLHQYYHAALRACDVWTVIPYPDRKVVTDNAFEMINKIIEADNSDIDDDSDD